MRDLSQIPELELAYIAGFFDGEGNIHISRREPKKSNRETHPVFDLTAGISQCDVLSVVSLQTKFGGALSVDTKRKRDLWKWQIRSNQAMAFLKAIRPYLKQKAAQADLAIEFQETRFRPNTKKGERLTPEIDAERQGYRDRLRAMTYGPKSEVVM